MDGIFGAKGKTRNVLDDSNLKMSNMFLGYPGNRGSVGIPGLSGLEGEKGFRGDLGRNGRPGLNGLPGDKGFYGEVGYPGARGSQGLPGTAGADGLDAPPGPRPKSRGYYFVMHSQSRVSPVCPDGTAEMWEGYSLLHIMGDAHAQVE